MRREDAAQVIRNAKRAERSMGTTFYQTKIDTATGDRTIVPTWQHGMKYDFSNSSPIQDGLAVLTGVASTIAIYKSGETFQKARIGKASINKTQKRNATIYGALGLLGFLSLSPLKIPLPGDAGINAGSNPALM